jgi:hypothetical protein
MMQDRCPTCDTLLTMVNADDVWVAECELGHLVKLTDELDVPVRLFGLLLAVLYLLAAYIETGPV